MHRLLALALAASLFALAPRAEARKVRWQKIEVRQGDDATRVTKSLSRLLKNATKKAQWGRGDSVKLSARLTKLTWEKHGDVLKISVTVVAKIVGGRGARSHIRIGGRPKNRTKLEKQALKIVSDGLITRLSDMARSEKKKAPAGK
jgi:hypothetical protein